MKFIPNKKVIGVPVNYYVKIYYYNRLLES